jgi:hypothetical protein
MPSHKYKRVTVDGKSMLAHRAAWIEAYGPIPAGLELDHIDRNRSNNDLSNLRLVTRSLNNLNLGAERGACWDAESKCYRARLKWKNKQYYLGRYDTKEEAAARAHAVRTAMLTHWQLLGVEPTTPLDFA